MIKLFLFILFLVFADILFAQNINYNYDSLGRVMQIIYPDSAIINYAYDPSGNRLKKATVQSTIMRSCPQSNIMFFSGSTDPTKTYQWQADAGNGFLNLSNVAPYSGVTLNTLTLNNAPTNLYGYKYRCVISKSGNNIISTPVTLKYEIRWSGTVDSLWTNTANWSCGILPDGNTDVIINSVVPHTPLVDGNAICRSLTANPEAAIKVKTGFNLNITGR